MEARDGLHVLVEHLALRVDGDAAHAVVDHRRHDPDVERAVGVVGDVVEELFAEGIDAFLSVLVILLQRLLERLLSDEHAPVVPLGQLLERLELGDKPLLGVESDVRLRLPRRRLVHHQRKLERLRLLLDHAAGDVVARPELVGKPMALRVQQHAALAAQNLRAQRLDLVVRVPRVEEACWVHLHVVQIHPLGSNSQRKLVPIPCRALVVGRGVFEEVRAVLLEQRVFRVVRRVAPRRDQHVPAHQLAT
mmetsp:Transcript_58990/g.138792  ORF Transcript_58990/g.138792 Transcript_58990/m.138792 type:complete len:249 (+) Transcript_58990:398-1144(+)